MKKLLLISAVLAAMFFMVSCENKLTSVSTHDVDDNTADSGKTGKEGGECYEDKSCDEGLSCEEERNLCVKNEDAGDDSDSLTDTDDDNDHGETTAETCAEIYQCVADCGIVGPSCEIYSGPYANPYGTAQINIASNYIVSEADNPDVTKIEMGSFITGNIGHSPIENPDTVHSYYYSMLYTTEQGQTFIRTIQFFTNENGEEIFNPFVIALTNISATAGSNHYGIFEQNNPAGVIMIVDADITDNDLDISCYHAFSEGELNIQNIVPSAGSEGALAVSGTIDLYSPKNYAYSLGDISAQLDVPVCNPQ